MRVKLLTIAQVADELGVSQSTIRRWVENGTLPVVRLPSGHRRFRPKEVEAVKAEMGLGKDPASE